jgi:Ca2+-binding EF-hand superfamily protein
LLTASPR